MHAHFWNYLVKWIVGARGMYEMERKPTGPQVQIGSKCIALRNECSGLHPPHTLADYFSSKISHVTDHSDLTLSPSAPYINSRTNAILQSLLSGLNN